MQGARGSGRQREKHGHLRDEADLNHQLRGAALLQEQGEEPSHRDGRHQPTAIPDQRADHERFIASSCPQRQVHGWASKRCDEHRADQQVNGARVESRPGHDCRRNGVAQETRPRTSALQTVEKDFQWAPVRHLGKLAWRFGSGRLEKNGSMGKEGEMQIGDRVERLDQGTQVLIPDFKQDHLAGVLRPAGLQTQQVRAATLVGDAHGFVCLPLRHVQDKVSHERRRTDPRSVQKISTIAGPAPL